MRLWCVIAWLLCVCAVTPCAAVTTDNIQLAGLQVEVWLPDKTGDARVKTPVIVFSHGVAACSYHYKAFVESLARAGYAVFIPTHSDSMCHKNTGVSQPEPPPLDKPGLLTDASYADRRQDIELVLNALSTDPRFSYLDWKHIGFAGHSLGGYIGLSMAGAWPGWKDGRIAAVLAVAPYVAPFMVHQSFKNISLPVMYQAGTYDQVVPLDEIKKWAYPQTRSPKFYVELSGAAHTSWQENGYLEPISQYSIAFFDLYLKHKPFPSELAHAHGKVSHVWADMEGQH